MYESSAVGGLRKSLRNAPSARSRMQLFPPGLVLRVQDRVNKRSRRLPGSNAEQGPYTIHAEEEQSDGYGPG
jgi:hypothetical protein